MSTPALEHPLVLRVRNRHWTFMEGQVLIALEHEAKRRGKTPDTVKSKHTLSLAHVSW